MRSARLRIAIAAIRPTCCIRPSDLLARRRRARRGRSGRRPARGRDRRPRRRPASWVTMTTVWPNSSTARRSSASTSSLSPRVEVAGRLVGEHDRGFAEQRPGDRDPLLLAARELGRAVRRAGRRARPRRSAARAAPDRASGRRASAAGGCSPRASSTGSRLKNWNTKPTLSRRSSVSSASSSVAEVDRRRSPPSPRSAGRGPARHVHQGRLAGARRTHDRGQPALGEVDVTPSSAAPGLPSPNTRTGRRRRCGVGQSTPFGLAPVGGYEAPGRYLAARQGSRSGLAQPAVGVASSSIELSGAAANVDDRPWPLDRQSGTRPPSGSPLGAR